MTKKDAIDFCRFLKLIGFYREFYAFVAPSVINSKTTLVDFICKYKSPELLLDNVAIPKLNGIKVDRYSLRNSYRNYINHKQYNKVNELLKKLNGKTLVKRNDSSQLIHILSVTNLNNIDFKKCLEEHAFKTYVFKISYNSVELDGLPRRGVRTNTIYITSLNDYLFNVQLKDIETSTRIVTDEEVAEIVEHSLEAKIENLRKSYSAITDELNKTPNVPTIEVNGEVIVDASRFISYKSLYNDYFEYSNSYYNILK